MDRLTWKRGIEALKKEYGHTAKEVMERQMSIFVGQLVKRYPPATQKQGRGALAQDLLGGRKIRKGKSAGIFQTDANVIATWESSIEAGLEGSNKTVRAFKSKSGAIYGVDKSLYRPNASDGEIRAHHLKYRSSKTNRVTTAGSLTRDIGRWKFVDKMYVNKSRIESYIRKTAKDDVGLLKSGWYQTRWRGGAKPPAWVKKHGDNSVTIPAMKDNGSGYLEIRNDINGTHRWKRIDQFVAKSRERGFQKELKYAIKKANTAGNKIK